MLRDGKLREQRRTIPLCDSHAPPEHTLVHVSGKWDITVRGPTEASFGCWCTISLSDTRFRRVATGSGADMMMEEEWC
jgi:hypothetical protein